MKSDHKVLEGIYHRGQEKIWDGRQVLQELLDKHNGICELAPAQEQALQNIFAVILHGENAAWKISLQLAEQVAPFLCDARLFKFDQLRRSTSTETRIASIVNGFDNK